MQTNVANGFSWSFRGDEQMSAFACLTVKNCPPASSDKAAVRWKL
jgi:hypothetical protein